MKSIPELFRMLFNGNKLKLDWYHPDEYVFLENDILKHHGPTGVITTYSWTIFLDIAEKNSWKKHTSIVLVSSLKPGDKFRSGQAEYTVSGISVTTNTGSVYFFSHDTKVEKL